MARYRHTKIGVSIMEVDADGAPTLIITGKMRETALFGHCFEIERKIVIPAGGARITVRDVVRNLTPKPEPVLFLYHINFEFPFLDEDLALEFPEGEVRGRTDLARKRIADYAKITPPIDGEPEVVYFHLPKERDVRVSLENKRLGLRAAIGYDSEQLPVLAQWKSMCSSDYALGIEPETSFIRGRRDELENGYDSKIPAFGQVEFGFCVELSEI